MWQRIDLLDQIEQTLKNPVNILKSLKILLNEKNDLVKQIEEFNKDKLKELRKTMISAVESYNGTNIISFEGIFPDATSVKKIAFDLQKEIDNLILMIGANVGGKPLLTVMIHKELVERKNLNSSLLIKSMAKFIQGDGGGQDFYATAGGKNTDGLTMALETGIKILKKEF